MFCSSFTFSGAFEDPDVIHVDDSVDPVRDLEIITEELRLKVSGFIANFLCELFELLFIFITLIVDIRNFFCFSYFSLLVVI